MVAPGDRFILVDDELSGLSGSIDDSITCIPFLEHEGSYYGPPLDADSAIRELERLRQTGCSFIVFAWPAFWWLDCYAEFHSYLKSKFRCLLHNDRLVIFELRQ
jgi:hypothetical protein